MVAVDRECVGECVCECVDCELKLAGAKRNSSKAPTER